MIRSCVLLALLCRLATAQEFNIVYGDTFKSDRGFTARFTEPNNNGIYFLTYYPQTEQGKIYFVNYQSEFYLHKLDPKNANFKFRINLHDSVGAERSWSKGYQHKSLHVLGGKAVFFTRVMDKSLDKLMMTIIDPDNGRKIGEPVAIYEISNKNLNGVLTKGYSDFSVVTSADQSKFAIISERKRDYKEQDVKVHIYDAQSMKLIWEAQAPTTFTNSTIFTSEYKLSNDGKLYFLFSYTQAEQEYLYGVGMMKNATEKAKLTAVTHKNKWLLEPHVELTGNGVTLHASYLETNMKMFSLVCPSGFFDAAFNLNVDLLGEIATETKETYGIKNDEQRTHDHIGTFNVGKDWYVVREHVYITPPDLRREGLIYVTKIGQDGKLGWVKQIPKSIEHYELTGILMRATDKELQLFYYEDNDNQEQYPDLNDYKGKKYKAARKPSDASLICVSVLPDGKLSRSVVTHKGHLLLPLWKYENSLQTDGKTFVVNVFDSKGKRSYCLLK